MDHGLILMLYSRLLLELVRGRPARSPRSRFTSRLNYSNFSSLRLSAFAPLRSILESL